MIGAVAAVARIRSYSSSLDRAAVQHTLPRSSAGARGPGCVQHRAREIEDAALRRPHLRPRAAWHRSAISASVAPALARAAHQDVRTAATTACRPWRSVQRRNRGRAQDAIDGGSDARESAAGGFVIT